MWWWGERGGGVFFPAVSWLVHWLAPLQDVLSGCRYLSLCVLSEVVSCSVKVSIHSFFPLSALFVTFKALQKCGHLSVGFLCICHMPVILGGTRGTCPSPEGCSQHVTGPPELGVVGSVASLTPRAVGNTKRH